MEFKLLSSLIGCQTHRDLLQVNFDMNRCDAEKRMACRSKLAH